MRKLVPFLMVCLATTFTAFSQCTTASLNWDALDYLATTGYSNATAQAVSPNQYFTFGKNRLNIKYATCTSAGENGTHTGSAGSYGSGDDVQYSGNGTVTLTFATAVTNLKFSVYDIDKGQIIAFVATNSGTPTALTLTKANAASTDISIAGNLVFSLTGNQAENTNTTTVNVDVAGPVTSVTLAITNSDTRNGGASDANFWLSDISACVTGSFPSNYFQVAQPFTGQPGYVLVSVNNRVYYVDPATGNAKWLFTDGATSATICSLAYDPYNNVVYYVWSLTNNGSANASERSLHKYDLKTGVASVLLTDIRSLNIPTYDQGVETSGAAFYDGAWYIGIEGGADRVGLGGPPNSTKTNRESVVWRIDFDANGTPVTATQAYGLDGDKNDWGDMSIVNGMLYNFNADGTYGNYTHYNLQTGAEQPYTYSGTAPKQTAVDWQGNVYWVNDKIAPYNYNGTIGPQKTITASGGIPNWSNTGAPLFTDGGEAFRPPFDFGDAPDTYDPDPRSPAMHEISANLRLGPASDWEFAKVPTNNATGDGSDEDGLTWARIYVNGSTYQADLKVYNNTGSGATVCAWLDVDNNGVFDPGEGVSYPVASSTSTQSINLFWNSLVSTLPNNAYTYLRIRITSAANGMTVNNPTGYYSNGEVEDYYVVVSNTPLDLKLTTFTASRTPDDKVKLNWTVKEEEPNTQYEVQKSADGRNWSPVYTQTAREKKAQATYQTIDAVPFAGDNYYRLKITQADGTLLFSSVEKLSLNHSFRVQIAPNPAYGTATLSIQSVVRTAAQFRVVDMSGRVLLEKNYPLEKGSNQFALRLQELAPGIYQTEWRIDGQVFVRPLVIQKQ